MRRHAILMVAALLFAASAQATLAQAQTKSLETTIRDYAREHNFNGAILIQHNHKKIYQQSFGLADRSFDIPINDDTKFRIASITKMFTAVLILQLYEQGKLDLHAPIKSYL